MNKDKTAGTNLSGIISVIFALLVPVLILFGLVLNMDNRKKEYEVVFIPKVLDQDNGFWTSLIAGVKLGAEEMGMRLTIIGPGSENDVETQIVMLREAIGQKPDAVLISPNDYSALDDVLLEVKQADIPIIFVDSVTKEDVAQSTVATDNYEAGERLGTFARTIIKGNSHVGIIGHVKDSSTAIEREKGIRDALSGFEGRIDQTRYCNSSFDRAYQLTKEMLQESPDMDIIIGTNEYASVGAARAIKDMNYVGKVHVLGFDSSLEETQLLEEGVFDCLVIQKPFNMGYLGILQAAKLLTEGKVEDYLDSGCKLITKDNMYEDENQKLLYPFVERK